ncbi:F-box/kelch-repeat protein At1g55270-like [Phragmites australis]|uniref:F-box/kelch-repeat protein At1g55270-like n=1 Tax=Phragmites australis TaxID=29695 RepID=UPI002D7A297C|nr:F-box/kelch-repeat protein At1g55270-like [Phragmites australis]
MATAMVPFASVLHGGRWYVKGLGVSQQVLSQVYSPEYDAWSVMLDGMVIGWRSPSACLDGGLYAADCKDDCRLRAYDEVMDAWTTCIDSKQPEPTLRGVERGGRPGPPKSRGHSSCTYV